MADKARADGGKFKTQAQAEREERLARALRDNLAKRKAQSRARDDETQGKNDPS